MKGNKMMRLIALMILVPAILAQITGQIDFSQPSWLWLTLFAGLNALQSSFTGICPATKLFGKDKITGQCCAPDNSGTCCTPQDKTASNCCDSTPSNSASGCCSSTASEQTNDVCSSSVKQANDCQSDAACLDVKILGSGCQNCATTYQLIEATAAELNVKCCLSKVEEIAEIAAYGVMATPGIVMNGKVVHSGSIPSKSQVVTWLSSEKTNGCCGS